MTFVLSRLSANPSATFMRPFEGGASEFRWGLVTYQGFLDAFRTAYTHWSQMLPYNGAQRGDVVGMW